MMAFSAPIHAHPLAALDELSGGSPHYSLAATRCSLAAKSVSRCALASSRGALSGRKLLVGKSSCLGPAEVRRLGRRVGRLPRTAAALGPEENMYEDFKEGDQDYVSASLLEATEVKSGSDGFVVKMVDGTLLRCAHNAAEGARLPDYAPQPAMVLKVEDGSHHPILLPLIVLKQPRETLIEAMRNTPLARPTVYLVIRDMIELMGYELKLVRITHRVSEAYYARIYLAKVGDSSGAVLSLDLRPSDAINLAVRAKVPIQVNRALAVGDGVRQVSTVPRGASRSVRAIRSYHFTWTEEDRAEMQSSKATTEFALVQLMETAVAEERFADAARIKEELKAFRAGVEEAVD